MMKTCNKCELEKKEDEFYNNKSMKSGKDNTCKKCKCKYGKKDRAENPEKIKALNRRMYAENREKRREVAIGYARKNKDRIKEYQQSEKGRNANSISVKKRRALHPEKFIARNALNRAVASGKIKRMPCEKCKTTKNIEAHHCDYSKPLDVVWLCRVHHAKLHMIVNRYFKH